MCSSISAQLNDGDNRDVERMCQEETQSDLRPGAYLCAGFSPDNPYLRLTAVIIVQTGSCVPIRTVADTAFGFLTGYTGSVD